MVDLVKIRKKAKEKKEEEAAAPPPPAAEPVPPASQPPAPRPERAAVPAQPVAAAPAGSKREPQPSVSEPPPQAMAQPSAGSAPAQGAPKLARFLETAGERQASGVQSQAAVQQEEAELLTFVISGEQYAIGIEQVVEIIIPRPVTRVPNAADTLVGILSLRGAIVTLIDVPRRLGHPPSAPTPETRVIVVEHNGENVGFLVDRVLRVVKIAEGAVEPQPVVHTSEQDISVRGVFRQGTALTILLDLENLLSNGTGL